MKTVFSRSMVAHVWASRSQEHGRTSSNNFHFVGGALFSYGTYCVASFTKWKHPDGRPVVLFDGSFYSVTTNRHAREAWSATHNLPVARYTVPDSAGFREPKTLEDWPAFVLQKCTTAIVARLLSAAKRISDDRRAADLEQAAEYATLARLACDNMRTARERKAGLASIPAIPAADTSRQELRGMVEVFARQEAAAKIPDALRTLHESLRSLDYAMRPDFIEQRLSSALRAANTLWDICKKAGKRYPAGVPKPAELYARHEAAKPARDKWLAAQYDHDVMRNLRAVARDLNTCALGYWQWERIWRMALDAEALESSFTRVAVRDYCRREMDRSANREKMQAARESVASLQTTCAQWLAAVADIEIQDNPNGAALAKRRLDELAAFPRLRADAIRQLPRAAAYLQRIMPESLEAYSPEIAARAPVVREWLAAYASREVERNARTIEAWRAGEINYMPAWSDVGATLLRLNGERIQTSRGAEVPAEHARRLWPVIFRARTSGQGFTVEANPDGRMRLGHFDLREVRADGSIVVGCHDIPWSEIVRMAETLGLYP